jgi:hypothetical protein
MKHLTAHSLFKPPNGLTAPSLFTPLDDSNSTSDSCTGTAEAHVVSSFGIPSSRGRITVQQIEVVAPSDLPEGYELDVEIEGFEHTVVVVRRLNARETRRRASLYRKVRSHAEPF